MLLGELSAGRRRCHEGLGVLRIRLLLGACFLDEVDEEAAELTEEHDAALEEWMLEFVLSDAVVVINLSVVHVFHDERVSRTEDEHEAHDTVEGRSRYFL